MLKKYNNITITENSHLRCCLLKICHSNCSIERDNPFCHDTKCRECRIETLNFEEADKEACPCCGYHLCEKCKINKNIFFPGIECPKCGL